MSNSNLLMRPDLNDLHVRFESRVADLDAMRSRVEREVLQRRRDAELVAVDVDFAPRLDIQSHRPGGRRCGLRTGRVVTRPWPGDSTPAAE